MSEDYSKRLKAVNETINTTNIKGKEYAEVNQRILAFWELFPNGRIVTTRLGDTGQRCDFKAEVFAEREDTMPISTGYAFEDRQGAINKTSYVENCETGAVGRALGMLGIGAMNALASADEVQGAIAQQTSGRQVTNGKPQGSAHDILVQAVKTLKANAIEEGADEGEINGWYADMFDGKPLSALTNYELEQVQTHLFEVRQATEVAQ